RAVSTRSISSSRSIRAADSSRRVARNFSCTGQTGGVISFISFLLVEKGGGRKVKGASGDTRGPPGERGKNRGSARLLLVVGAGRVQCLAQGGRGVQQPLAGAADLGDGPGIMPVEGALFTARLDQAADRLLGGAQQVPGGLVHRWSSLWGEDGVGKER